MGRRRANQPQLPEWLAACAQPVILRDEAGLILTLNAAAASWLGVEVKDALGRTSHPGNSGSAEPLDRRLAGLAIEVGSGNAESTLVYSLDDAGQPVVVSAQTLVVPAGDGQEAWLLTIVGHDAGKGTERRVAEAAMATARVELARQRAQTARAAQVFSLLGSSPVAERLRAQVHAASTADSHVMVAGPAGGEQELLARRIHALRYVKSGKSPPLTPVQCRAADQAFIQDVIRHALAERSQFDPPVVCLLLVDVERLDSGSQTELAGFLRISPALIRLFATRTVARRGAVNDEESPAPFDTFLEAQLSAQTIVLPQLAQRRMDLAGMMAAVTDSASRQKGHGPVTLSPVAIETLTEYSWPGEVAELSSALAQMLSKPSGKTLEVGDLPEAIRLGIAAQRGSRLPAEQVDLEKLLETVEREVMERALALCRNNRSEAARHLGLSRAKLLRRCAHLGIVLPGEAIDFEPVEFDEVQE